MSSVPEHDLHQSTMTLCLALVVTIAKLGNDIEPGRLSLPLNRLSTPLHLSRDIECH